MILYVCAVQCIEKLTKYLRAFTKGSHVPVHENVMDVYTSCLSCVVIFNWSFLITLQIHI